MDGDRGDAELLGRAQDAQRDLAAVGDEDLVEHPRSLMRLPIERAPSFDDEQRLAVFDRRSVLDEDFDDLAGPRRDDFVEGLHRLDEQDLVAGLHDRADLDERLGFGLARR